MRRLHILMLLVNLVAWSGCASVRESVNWEFSSEKVELAPHEERRAVADRLAEE